MEKRELTKAQRRQLADQAMEATNGHFHAKDSWELGEILVAAIAGDFDYANRAAERYDTIIREAIPALIWLEMGGELTKNGENKAAKELEFLGLE